MTLRVKANAGAETALALPLRAAMAEIDRRVPVLSIQTLTEHRDASETILGLTIVSVVFGAFVRRCCDGVRESQPWTARSCGRCCAVARAASAEATAA